MNASLELGGAVGKKVLEGGSKKTPPPPSSLPSYLIPNPAFVVEEPPVHHPRPIFTCCFPISASHTTSVHTSTYSDLQPKFPEEVVFRGQGGDFLSWKRNGNEIGASMIVLHQNGLAQPSFSDHSKVAIVLKGSGTAGLLLPYDNLAEKVVAISAGDLVAVPSGTVTWWFNPRATDLTVVFLGRQHFTDFCFAGPSGVIGGFSSEVLSTFLGLDEAAVATVLSSQTTQGRIVRVGPEVNMPPPNILDRQRFVFNPFRAAVQGDGDASFLDSSNLLLLKDAGCGALIVRLASGCKLPPTYACATKFQLIFIFSGSGHVEVVGPNGSSIIDAAVETGHLFLVPKTGVLSATAGDNGLRWISIIDTPRPSFVTLVGENSLLTRLSGAVVEGAFNVDPDMESRMRFPTAPPH